MIINDHVTNYDLAKEILKKDIEKHLASKCDCKEQDGKEYPCRANEWLRGAVTSQEIIDNYHYEKARH
jgi:hypothetical protein